MLTVERKDPVLTGNILDAKDRLTLASLVAKTDERGNRNAHILGSNNNQEGIVELALAIETDLPFFVFTDRSILALDGDKESDLATIKTFARVNQIEDRAVICTSGGGAGRAHLFLKVKTKKEYDRLKANAKTVGLDVRQSIRPPGTAHRNGIDRSELHELTAAQAIQRLSTDTRQAEIEYRLRHGWPERTKLQGGQSTGLFWLAVEYNLLGFSQRRYANDVLSNPHGAGHKIQKLSRAEQERYLRNTWEKAQLEIQTRPSSQAAGRWFVHAIRTVGLKSKLINTIGEIYKLAVVANATSLRISVRTFPQSAGTNSKHLRELAKLGLLEQTSWFDGDKSPTLAQTYRLNIDDAKEIEHNESFLVGGVLDHVFRNLRMMDVLHDRRSATRVVLSLVLFPNITAAELAERMGLNRRSVELQLRWLKEIGLAEQHGGRYIVITERENAKRVAEKRGAVDRRKGIAERQERERQAYKRAIELREVLFKSRAEIKERRILYRLDQQAQAIEQAEQLPNVLLL